MTTERLEAVVAAYLKRHKNKHTRRTYQQALEPLVEQVGGGTPLALIVENDLDEYEDHLHERNLADATIASHIKRMKAFWNWCIAREYVAVSPARHLKVGRRRENKSAKALAPDIRTAMFTAVQQKREELCRVRDTAILALIMTYGARSIDIARLTLRRVNFTQGWLVFDRKGHNEDRQPLPPDTAHILRNWADYRSELNIDPPHDYLFVSIQNRDGHRHQPLQASSIQTMFKRLALKVCGQMHGPHSARHLRAQELLDAGFPREVVAQILGHSSTDTLAHYANQDWERHKRTLDATELGRAPGPIAPPQPKRGKIIQVDPDYFRRHAQSR